MVMALLFVASLCGYNINYIEQRIDYTEIQIDLRDVTINDEGDFTQVTLPLASNRSEAGVADLPYLLLHYAVPEGCELEVSVSEGDKRVATISKPIYPIGRPSDDDSLVSEYIIDDQKYRQQPVLYEIQPKQSINQYDYISVEINPLRYSYIQNRVEYPEQLIVKATILGNINRSTTLPPKVKYDLYTDLFVNYTYAPAFQVARGKQYYTSNFSRSQMWYKMYVRNDGMYVLDNQNLPAEVLRDVDPRQIRLFSTGGAMMLPDFNDSGYPFEEIPIHVVEGEGGSFTQQTRLYFYANQRDGFGKNLPLGDYDTSGELSDTGDFIALNPYSKEGVYWLTWGSEEAFGSPPKRMDLQTFSSASIQRTTGRVITHSEESVGFVGSFYANMEEQLNMDWWYMRDISGDTDITINFPDLNPLFPQTFYFVAMSYGATGSSLTPYLNDIPTNNPIALRYFPIKSVRKTGYFLQSGTNILRFSPTAGGARKLLKSYTIEWTKDLIKQNGPLYFQINKADNNQNVQYTLENENNQVVWAYQVDNFYSVKRIPIQGLSFIANADSLATFYVYSETDFMRPTGITLTNSSILDHTPPPHDVLIIYPEEFESSIPRLTSIYHQQDYTVHTATLESVFDNFSGGHPDPVAVKNYLHFIQLNTPEEQSRSLGAVFIGSGTLDQRNFSGNAAAKNKFILNQIGVKPLSIRYIKENTSDDYFANFTTYRYPEVIVGRIPVRTSTEFNVYMDKMEAYIRNDQPGWWQYNFQIIADDFVYKNEEQETTHSVLSEEIGNYIKNHIIVDRLFAQEYPLNPLKRKPNVKNVLVDKINEGRLYWMYFGHGSIRNCGDEQYFNADEDISLLHNKDKYPIFVAASCNVGQYDLHNRTSLCEELLFRRDAGSIVSIGATRKSYGGSNRTLLRHFFEYALKVKIQAGVSEELSSQHIIGKAFMSAKQTTPTIYTDNGYYNILGDPFLKVSYPIMSDSLFFVSGDSIIYKRDTVSATGIFPVNITGTTASIRAYDNGKSLRLNTNPPIGAPVQLSKENLPIFNGSSSIENSQYNVNFVVPDDAQAGSAGKIFALTIGENNKVYIDKLINIAILDSLLDIQNTDAPQIDLYLDSRDFVDGGEVGQSAVLIADIYDENGINIIGNPGRNIMIRVSSSTEVLSASSGFKYDVDSYQRGTLTWPLNNLPVGNHIIEVVVYDSFNRPAVARIHCKVLETVPLVITNALIYPNPIKRDGYFTFEIDLKANDTANIIIDIYTITGRKIRTIRDIARSGYNQIHWDGKDGDGDSIANNTYFYKLKANSLLGKGSCEITDKFIKLR